MSKRTLTIGEKQIIAEEKDLKQSDLLFYQENPRIYSILQKLGDNPSQKEIEKEMISRNHVKTLKESIKVNGGLLEPIIVKDNIVLEGNSRLAAYRILAMEDPIKWGNIKCNVLPNDTKDDTITALLGTLHVIGKTAWNPFEQAGFLVRRLETSRKSIDALAQELGLKKSETKLSIEVYQKMVAENDIDPDKWSYYYELLKNRAINKYDENNPTVCFKDTIIEKIKNDEIEKATDIRKYAILAKAIGENVEEAIDDVLHNNISIDEAVDLVSAETKIASITAKVESFYSYLTKEQQNISDNSNNEALKYKLKQIEQIIKTTLKI